jgi:hypothetical protein
MLFALGLLLACGAAGRTPMSDADAEKLFSNPKTIELAHAALADDANRVRALIAEGTDANAQGEDNLTLLQWALLRKSTKAMMLLLDAGADPSRPGFGGDTVIHLAAKADDLRYLNLLLEHGADPNAPHGITQAPPLDAALMNPRNEAFELLLAHHADPNRADRMGNTPLHVAAQVHKSACVLQLLEAGADASARNKHGDTFQTYFNMLPAGGLNPAGKANHDAVHRWLREHHVVLEQGVH